MRALAMGSIACLLGSGCIYGIGTIEGDATPASPGGPGSPGGPSRPGDPGGIDVPASPGGPPSGAGGSPSLPAQGGASGLSCVRGQAPPAARIYRLTKLDLQNTVADLFGAGAPAIEIEADTRALGFTTGDGRSVGSSYAASLKGNAEALAAAFRKTVKPGAFAAGCFGNDAGGRTCAGTFVRDFGARAYRRPLAEAEVTALLAVYDSGRDTGRAGDAADRFAAGVEWLVIAMLRSPNFVHRTELGAATAANGATTKLTPHELASAISYVVLASPPDAMLMAAASAGKLDTPAGIAAEVRRLTAARPDRWKAQARRFVLEWLGIDYANPAWSKDTTVYPAFSAALEDSVRAETDLFLDDWSGGEPTFTRLMTTNLGFVSRATAPLYGVAPPASVQKVALDAGKRSGILTQSAFLATHAHVDASSPVLRGVTIMRSLLCLQPPVPPANVPPLPPATKSTAKTTRQRYEMHINGAGPACTACHSQFNPLGLPFEAYDGLGAYRTEENGVAVDTSGALVGTTGDDRPVANAVELVQALAASPDVHECVSRQLFRYTVGREETPFDGCSLAGAAQAFTTKGLDVRELLIGLLTSESFSTRTAAVGP